MASVPTRAASAAVPLPVARRSAGRRGFQDGSRTDHGYVVRYSSLPGVASAPALLERQKAITVFRDFDHAPGGDQPFAILECAQLANTLRT